MDRADAAFVKRVEFAPECVDKRLLDHVSGEVVLPLEEDLLQAPSAFDFLAGRQDAGDVERRFGGAFAPGADGVKVVESEAKRVDLPVAPGARSLRGMLGELLAERAGLLLGPGLLVLD